VTTPIAALATSDGRRHRSARTRDALADALLDLIVDGRLRPTAKEIAERAGVSVRSVYVHFDDLEDLMCVATARHYARIAPMLEPVPLEGSLTTRAHALVERRIRLYARIGAVGRATQLHAPFSPTLAKVVSNAHARSRAELERVFAPELDALAPGTRGTALALLDVLTGPQTWETLRDVNGLSVDDAAEAVVTAIIRQLAADR
jgi:TetR/AcrR family transcriptional regulator of autoinduction and epiphytic fitness